MNYKKQKRIKRKTIILAQLIALAYINSNTVHTTAQTDNLSIDNILGSNQLKISSLEPLNIRQEVQQTEAGQAEGGLQSLEAGQTEEGLQPLEAGQAGGQTEQGLQTSDKGPKEQGTQSTETVQAGQTEQVRNQQTEAEESNVSVEAPQNEETGNTPAIDTYQSIISSKTLEMMAYYDYVMNSVTGISKAKKSLANLKSLVKNYGTLYGNGMPFKEYIEAMEYIWTDATEYTKEPVKLSVDIKKTMNYETYVNTLKKLSRIEGVFLYKIGKSTEGRDIYAVEIDVPSDYDKNVIMLTGQVHAREFGPGTFLVKQLVDLVQKAQIDEDTMELLKKNKYVAVPIINVDGREALINAPSEWTVEKGGLWKAYINGTDGNRNFPGLQWGQVMKGKRYKSSIALTSGYANFPGEYAGSNNETKALMKFLYQYIVVEQADIYLDCHSQGSIIYAGKTWQTAGQMQRSMDLRTNIMNVLNEGNKKRKYTAVYESEIYGLQGEGSSLTDYAVSLAVGAKYSPAYCFLTFVSGEKEIPLLEVKDLDTYKTEFKEANKKFAAVTLEIGYGTDYLGNSSKTRRLLADEYINYNFDKLMEALPDMIKNNQK